MREPSAKEWMSSILYGSLRSVKYAMASSRVTSFSTKGSLTLTMPAITSSSLRRSSSENVCDASKS